MKQCIGRTQDVVLHYGSGIKGFKGSLKLKEGVKPVFMKDRPVPYSLVEKVEKSMIGWLSQIFYILYPSAIGQAL